MPIPGDKESGPLKKSVLTSQLSFVTRRQPTMETMFHTVFHLAVHERPLPSFKDEIK